MLTGAVSIGFLVLNIASYTILNYEKNKQNFKRKDFPKEDKYCAVKVKIE